MTFAYFYLTLLHRNPGYEQVVEQEEVEALKLRAEVLLEMDRFFSAFRFIPYVRELCYPYVLHVLAPHGEWKEDSAKLDGSMRPLGSLLARMEQRMVESQAKMQGEIDNLKATLTLGIDELNGKLDKLTAK